MESCRNHPPVVPHEILHPRTAARDGDRGPGRGVRVNRQQWSALNSKKATERILGKVGYKGGFGESNTVRATSKDGKVHVEFVQR